MRARRLVLLAVLALAGAPRVLAAPLDLVERGPLLAIRGGVAVAQGAVARGAPDVSDFIERKVPLGFEVGYRLRRRLWAELQFELAPAKAASRLCAADAACSGSDFRFGLALQLRLLPGQRVDPWVGVGAAVEVLNAEGFDPATSTRTKWSWAGVELPFVEAGVDLAMSRWVAIGPFAAVGFGQFTSESTRPDGGATVSGTIPARATHRWLTAGLRATLKL